jgi:hypothetical protein
MHRPILGLTGIAIFVGSLGWTSVRPARERNWILEQSRLATADMDGDVVTIRNVRDFRWGADGSVRPSWETRRYDVAQLESVWYVLTPFSQAWRGPAHAFVSFGFADGSFVSISVEARREVGEAYSLVRGMLKRFEVMYVIGDERDLIQLRTNQHGDDVYLYPMRASPEQIRYMFEGMLQRANRLAAEPEFYDTFGNNCTTNLLAHVNEVASRRIRYGMRVLLPGYSDQLAHSRRLIDTDLPLEAARRRYAVTEQSRRHGDDADYSLLIRASD